MLKHGTEKNFVYPKNKATQAKKEIRTVAFEKNTSSLSEGLLKSFSALSLQLMMANWALVVSTVSHKAVSTSSDRISLLGLVGFGVVFRGGQQVYIYFFLRGGTCYLLAFVEALLILLASFWEGASLDNHSTCRQDMAVDQNPTTWWTPKKTIE